MKDVNLLCDTLSDCLFSANESDSNGETANIVDGLFAIAGGLQAIASSLKALGNGNASTDLGAIENLGIVLKDGFSELVSALQEKSNDGT